MALRIGADAPAFELKNVDGTTVSLDSLKNGAGALAIVFSCNHCPYVLAWEDRLIQIARDYAPRGARFALINANDPVKYPADSFPEMQSRAKMKAYPFPYLFDETQEVARAYGAERTPEVFLFDSSGKLAYHGAPDDNYDDPSGVRRHYLREALDAVLAGSPPPVAETPPVGCTIKWK
jgi:peroxiredoxin